MLVQATSLSSLPRTTTRTQTRPDYLAILISAAKEEMQISILLSTIPTQMWPQFSKSARDSIPLFPNTPTSIIKILNSITRPRNSFRVIKGLGTDIPLTSPRESEYHHQSQPIFLHPTPHCVLKCSTSLPWGKALLCECSQCDLKIVVIIY